MDDALLGRWWIGIVRSGAENDIRRWRCHCFRILSTVAFGNATTRAFLPEPLMTMWIILALLAIFRWIESSAWKWSITAGVFCGLAVLTKVFAVFPLIPAFALVVITSFGLRRTLKNLQFWVIVALAALSRLHIIFSQIRSLEAITWQRGCCHIRANC